jgi:hypothetical protein
VVFPQPSGLRPLVSKYRRIQIVHLKGQRPGVEAVFHEAPCHAGRALGLERDAAAALVQECVHLLLHDIGGAAHAAQKKLGMLKEGIRTSR